MTIIALDRFVVVCYSHRQRMQVKTSMLFIAIIDALAIAFVVPYGFHIKMIVGFDGDARCNEVWMGWSRDQCHKTIFAIIDDKALSTIQTV